MGKWKERPDLLRYNSGVKCCPKSGAIVNRSAKSNRISEKGKWKFPKTSFLQGPDDWMMRKRVNLRRKCSDNRFCEGLMSWVKLQIRSKDQLKLPMKLKKLVRPSWET